MEWQTLLIRLYCDVYQGLCLAIELAQAIISYLWHGELYADKAYVSEALAHLLEQQRMSLRTPVKKAKGREELGTFEKLWSGPDNTKLFFTSYLFLSALATVYTEYLVFLLQSC